MWRHLDSSTFDRVSVRIIRQWEASDLKLLTRKGRIKYRSLSFKQEMLLASGRRINGGHQNGTFFSTRASPCLNLYFKSVIAELTY